MRRIQERFERIPRKSARRASRAWNTATNCLACVEAPFTLQLSPSFLITLYFKNTIKILLCLTVVILSFISILQTLRDGKREVCIILFLTPAFQCNIYEKCILQCK